MDTFKDMKVKFYKDYFQDAKSNKNGEYIVEGDLKTMYHFEITKDYFISDQSKVLKLAIKDLEQLVQRLKEVDRQKDKAAESWDSISK